MSAAQVTPCEVLKAHGDLTDFVRKSLSMRYRMSKLHG